MLRRIGIGLGVLAAAGLALVAFAYGTATRDPVVRRTAVALGDWPAGAAAIDVLLVSDIHVAGPDMPPERLARLVGAMNALEPDLVLFAGDFVSDKRAATRHYPVAEAIAPLERLRAPAVAVLGNHDHWRDAAATRAALGRAGIRLLANNAVRAGPLALGGLDDDFTGRADPARMLAAMAPIEGAKVVLSHSPDPFPALPGTIGLTLAGHTHCGQIALPLVGPIATMSDHGRRYACGRVDEAGRTLIVGAGIGTSLLPLRLGAVPDIWLVRLGPG